MALRRRRHVEGHNNQERWIVSYADLLTVLLAFFVVMYGISSVDADRYKKLTEALSEAFSDGSAKKQKIETITPPKPEPERVVLTPEQLEAQAMTALGKRLANALGEYIKADKIQVVETKKGLRVDLTDELLFAEGSALLSDRAKRPLMLATGVLRDKGVKIVVEGHTSKRPIHNALFYSNWELSATRASTVVRFLEHSGIASQRLSATGFGPYRPADGEPVADDTASNRRVSLMLIKPSLAGQDEDIAVVVPTP